MLNEKVNGQINCATASKDGKIAKGIAKLDKERQKLDNEIQMSRSDRI